MVDEGLDPQVAATKLAWWRTEVANLFAGKAQHPVTRALEPHLKSFGITAEKVQTQIESTVGVLVWIVTGGPISFVLNADRVGAATQPERWGLSLAAAVAVAAVWRLSIRRPAREPAGGAALCAITCVLIFSPVFSLQYVAWLLPWAAIAHQDEPDGPALVLAPIVILSAVLNYFYIYGGSLGLFQVTALLRDGLCVALVVWWIVRTSRRAPEPLATRA